MGRLKIPLPNIDQSTAAGVRDIADALHAIAGQYTNRARQNRGFGPNSAFSESRGSGRSGPQSGSGSGPGSNRLRDDDGDTQMGEEESWSGFSGSGDGTGQKR
jgi:hypothetical protein